MANDTATLDISKLSLKEPLRGHCSCRTIEYELLAAPLMVHCCHCTYCQRETGAAFAVNLIIESSNLKLSTDAQPTKITVSTNSGTGQKIVRCPKCQVCVWAHYGGQDELLSFVKAGTLDRPNEIQEGVHIYTSTKMPWLELKGTKYPVFEESYQVDDVWPKESLERLNAIRAVRKERKENESEGKKTEQAGAGEKETRG